MNTTAAEAREQEALILDSLPRIVKGVGLSLQLLAGSYNEYQRAALEYRHTVFEGYRRETRNLRRFG